MLWAMLNHDIESGSHYWPFCERKPSVNGGSLHKEPVMYSLYAILAVEINETGKNDQEKYKLGVMTLTLHWRHNERGGVSDHQSRDCLLNRLFKRRSKKTSKLRVTGLCAGNSPMTDEFPAQRASNAENVSIWWRHHDGMMRISYYRPFVMGMHWSLVEFTNQWWIPITKGINVDIWYVFVVSITNLLDKQSMHRLFETPWHACYVTVLCCRILDGPLSHWVPPYGWHGRSPTDRWTGWDEPRPGAYGTLWQLPTGGRRVFSSRGEPHPI